MKCIVRKLFFFVLFALASVNIAIAQSPVFPQKEGSKLYYKHYDGDGEFDATCCISLSKVTGNNTNGALELTYSCHDEKGKPYFDGPNEFHMQIRRENAQTYITMDKMAKTIKVSNLITAGDVSTITAPMTVGDILPDTQIFTTLGPFKATLTISEKKVLDKKTIRVDGKDYECWLVHEKILTKTPFGTDTATADTWYAVNAGCISQTVYDAKGRLKGKLELTSAK